MDNPENNKDRNFGRVAVGHLTPATSQTFKSFISNMFHIMFHVTIKYQFLLPTLKSQNEASNT